MRWDAQRERWHELTRVGTDALAVFGWLHWCGADVSGLFFQSPDAIARELALPTRRRAIAAIAKLAKTDDPAEPALGEMDAVLSYDGDHFVGYLHGWNLPRAENAPRNHDNIAARIAFAQRQPDCEPVRRCLAELALHNKRWVPATGDEVGLATMYREALTGTGAAMPSSADIAEGTPLRTAMAAAWTKIRLPEKAPWPAERWHAYFQAVAARVERPAGTIPARQMAVPVSLLWLLDDETMVAVRGNAAETNRTRVKR